MKNIRKFNSTKNNRGLFFQSSFVALLATFILALSVFSSAAHAQSGGSLILMGIDAEGPNAGLMFSAMTNAMGAATFNYTSPANAKSAFTLSCEQGHQNSWKVCEVRPEGYPTYIWSVSGHGIIDPNVCTSSSTICTAWCRGGSGSGTIYVSVYDSSNQLVGSRSRGLGCL